MRSFHAAWSPSPTRATRAMTDGPSRMACPFPRPAGPCRIVPFNRPPRPPARPLCCTAGAQASARKDRFDRRGIQRSEHRCWLLSRSGCISRCCYLSTQREGAATLIHRGNDGSRSSAPRTPDHPSAAAAAHGTAMAREYSNVKRQRARCRGSARRAGRAATDALSCSGRRRTRSARAQRRLGRAACHLPRRPRGLPVIEGASAAGQPRADAGLASAGARIASRSGSQQDDRIALPDRDDLAADAVHGRRAAVNAAPDLRGP